MNPIQLILIALRGLSVMTNNPALGGGSSVRLQEASKLLDFLGELLERGDEAHTELKEFAESVKAMAEGGRAPSTEEWQALQDRSDAAHDVIQTARREAEAEEAAEEEEERRRKEEAEAEERRLKEEALKEDLARLSDEDLQFNADSFGIETEGLDRGEIEALVLEAKLKE